MASGTGGPCTVPRARNGQSGGYCTRSVSRLGGWVRWIGCAAVWEAGRAVCGERHLGQTQAYSPTATEDDGVGRGNIHTYAIGNNCATTKIVEAESIQQGVGAT